MFCLLLCWNYCYVRMEIRVDYPIQSQCWNTIIKIRNESLGLFCLMAGKEVGFVLLEYIIIQFTRLLSLLAEFVSL